MLEEIKLNERLQLNKLNASKHIYTVSQLTQDIKSVLEHAIGSVWVEGEISNFTHYSSGHAYFSLKDENALINVCLFRRVNQTIRFKLTDGLKVICLGNITVYGKRGQYQLVIQNIYIVACISQLEYDKLSNATIPLQL